jgi:acyl carrier protein
MTIDIISTLAGFISGKILKQPGRIISPDEPLISSGMIDSFSLVDLALFVEDSFGVRLEDSELNAGTFDTLSQLLDLIIGRQSK